MTALNLLRIIGFDTPFGAIASEAVMAQAHRIENHPAGIQVLINHASIARCVVWVAFVEPLLFVEQKLLDWWELLGG